MNQTQEQTQINNTNEIEIKKRVYLYVHNDGFSEKNLEPLILIDSEKIHLAFIKRKHPFDIFYIFQNKKYIKIWNDKKGNILTYVSNWIGELFIDQKQTTEYIDHLSYTVGENGLTCEDKEGIRKKLILEGFDILSLIINEFQEHEDAILYILCTKLS